MDHFNEESYVVLRNVIDKSLLSYLQLQSKLTESLYCSINSKNPENYPFGDIDVPTSFSYYASICTETLLLLLLPLIEKTVSKQLFPTYSYMRIYYNGSVLNRHIDRPSCEYSVTVCIQNDETTWDIWFEKKDGQKINIALHSGDIIVYKGEELPHWREKYEGKQQIQFFLHYVDKNGKNSHLALDGRKMIGYGKS